MKRAAAIAVLLFVAVSVSGCIFSSDDDKDVKKGKISGKITMVITGEPVANVKVMLINQSAKIDTANFANNSRALVDSAVTDANGEFVLDGVAPGHYGIVPVNSSTDTMNVYKFSGSGDAGTYDFTLNGESRTVNFIAESLSIPAGSESYFTIEVVLKNIYYPLTGVYCERVCYMGVLPGLKACLSLSPTEIEPYTYLVRIGVTYGYTWLLYTETNNFLVHLDFGKPQILYDDFYVGHDFRCTPAYSKYEYDHFTGALTRLQ